MTIGARFDEIRVSLACRRWRYDSEARGRRSVRCNLHDSREKGRLMKRRTIFFYISKQSEVGWVVQVTRSVKLKRSSGQLCPSNQFGEGRTPLCHPRHLKERKDRKITPPPLRRTPNCRRELGIMIMKNECIARELRISSCGSTVVPRVVTDAGVNCFLPAG